MSYLERRQNINSTGPKPRKGFSADGDVICKACFNKNIEIDKLKEELRRLNALIQRKTKKDITPNIPLEEPHEPSSRKKYKTNSTLDNRGKKGGAKLGHRGHGRSKGGDTNSPNEVISHPTSCPCCNIPLITKDQRKRTVVEVEKIRATKRNIHLKRGQCPKCKKLFLGEINVAKRGLYGNRLLSQAIVMHYVHGVPIGRILEIFGPHVKEGGLINAFHRIGELCKEAVPKLTDDYRKSSVRHADETGWRTDGHSGYSWLFTTDKLSIFRFTNTRSARIALEILGTKPLDGVLVVDRYNGYNKILVEIQYCYAHLLREVFKLEKEFPDNLEIKIFVKDLTAQLKSAMKLRKKGLEIADFRIQASEIKNKILNICRTRYNHLGIIRIQDIFLTKEDRLFLWVFHPKIPAENNLAERDLRPTVIARKVSFGSQSERGTNTRSHIMSILWTAKKRLKDISIEDWMFESLNKISNSLDQKIYDLLPLATNN
jgi:hypothetical protein